MTLSAKLLKESELRKQLKKSIGVYCQTGASPTQPWYFVGSQERQILTKEDGSSIVHECHCLTLPVSVNMNPLSFYRLFLVVYLWQYVDLEQDFQLSQQATFKDCLQKYCSDQPVYIRTAPKVSQQLIPSTSIESITKFVI